MCIRDRSDAYDRVPYPPGCDGPQYGVRVVAACYAVCDLWNLCGTGIDFEKDSGIEIHRSVNGALE